jgi:hypothetical protein
LAAVTRLWAIGLMAAVVSCGKLQGLAETASPLVNFHLRVDGDPEALRPAGSPQLRLRVALVWGEQWQIEPFCILPPESPEAAAVIAAGCRDPFGFVPLRVAANVPAQVGQETVLGLPDLPAADVMVGDVTARVAYGTLVAYDDRDGDETLRLARPHRTRSGGDEGGHDDVMDSTDIVYGASFLTMTAPDQRIAFREGAFVSGAAFYPRSGCGAPPPQFSVLAAGGFSAADAVAATAAGRLPPEDPATCSESAPEAALIRVPLDDPTKVREVGCLERTDDSSIRYREPPSDKPDLTDRLTACAHLPSFDAGHQSQLIQLVVSGRSTDRCRSLTHYTLRGCRENVDCPVPDWDYTATPPAWWPCH